MYFWLARTLGFLGLGYWARARKDKRRALESNTPRGAKSWTGEEYWLLFSGLIGMLLVATLTRIPNVDPNTLDTIYLLAIGIWFIITIVIRQKLSEAFRR